MVSAMTLSNKLKDRKINTLEASLKSKETEDDKVVKLHA
jgi:hypothetical protein